tara:strand:+ start:593 stop:766 length:174 start_codon:yes stop_codon:yes gene_type:complete
MTEKQFEALGKVLDMYLEIEQLDYEEHEDKPKDHIFNDLLTLNHYLMENYYMKDNNV